MKLGWAFFSLAVVVMLAYGLNRGLFIGSDIVRVTGGKVAADGQYLAKRCRYLFPSGVSVQIRGGWNTHEEADNEFCQLFRD